MKALQVATWTGFLALLVLFFVVVTSPGIKTETHSGSYVTHDGRRGEFTFPEHKSIDEVKDAARKALNDPTAEFANVETKSIYVTW